MSVVDSHCQFITILFYFYNRYLLKNMDSSKVNVLASMVVAIGFAIGTIILYRKKRKNITIPDDWREVGTLSDLMCFPVKSCGVIRMNSTECTQLGLRCGLLRDRTFVVVDSTGNFITARKYPKLVLVKPTVVNDHLVLEAPDMPILKINMLLVKSTKNFINITVWNFPMKSKDCGDEAAKWFSQFILGADSGLRMAFHLPVEGQHRKSREKELIKDEDTGIYPDMAAYNLINESSVTDFNNRSSDKNIKAQNFRPNFVIKGAEPLEEDYWRWVKIGEVVFQVVRQCTRCVLTTVDPETGVKNVSGEPLKTLDTYRKIGDPKIKDFNNSKPVMGIQMAIRKKGQITLGDKVYIAK